jgi:hypothetical protein
MAYFSNLSFILVILLFLAQSLCAKQVVAVLEIIPTADASVSISEAQHITNELRRQATLTLSDSYTVLTRDNLLSLIPQDEAEADKLIESGVIGIGKAIGAGYVTQGYIKVFGNFLSLSVELYETESGRLVGNVVIEAPSAMELLKLVRENSPALFAKIDKSSSPKIMDPSQEPVPAASSESPLAQGVSQGQSFWTTRNALRVAAFALSAVSLGVGIYQNSQMGGNVDDAKKKEGDFEANERLWKDFKSHKNMRNGFYIGAGVFGVAGAATFFF